MNVQVKSSIIIIVTLIIGVLLGAMVSGPLLHSRMDRRLHGMRTAHGLADRFEDIVQPDESQRDTVRAILAVHSRQVHEIMSRSHAELSEAMDSLQNELAPVLTEDQKDRLNSHLENLPDRKPGRRGRPFRGR